MAKSRASFKVESFGIYDGFTDNGKTLPKIKKVCELIPAQIDTEFGFILHATKAKGLLLDWCIEHPDVPDNKGKVMPPFEGQVQVRTNDWKFYLGDTIWAPEHDKTGCWRMYIKSDNTIIAEQSFDLTLDDLESQQQAMFWKRRGF